MSCQIHRIVKNSHDLDHMIISGTVHDEMSSPAAMTRDMKGTKPGANLVTRHTSRHVRTSIKRGKRLKDGNSVLISP
jgi:hypothetical protein